MKKLSEEVCELLEKNPNVLIVEHSRPEKKPYSNFSNSGDFWHISIVPKINYRKVKNLDRFFETLIPKKYKEEWNYGKELDPWRGKSPKNKKVFDTDYKVQKFSIERVPEFMQAHARYCFEEEIARFSIKVEKNFIYKHPKFKGEFEKKIEEEHKILDNLSVYVYPSKRIYNAMKNIPRGKSIPKLKVYHYAGNPYAGTNGLLDHVLKMEDVKKYGLSY